MSYIHNISSNDWATDIWLFMTLKNKKICRFRQICSKCIFSVKCLESILSIAISLFSFASMDLHYKQIHIVNDISSEMYQP